MSGGIAIPSKQITADVSGGIWFLVILYSDSQWDVQGRYIRRKYDIYITIEARICSSRHYDTKMPKDDEDEGGDPSSESLLVAYSSYIISEFSQSPWV
jgi:hypothetical protein